MFISRKFVNTFLETSGITVESSNVFRIAYAQNSMSRGTLVIEFHSGRIYLYENVPPPTYGELFSSGSVGTYFNQYIKDNFPSQEVTD